VFCEKSLQAIENKRSKRGKERKERKRVRKSMKTKGRGQLGSKITLRRPDRVGAGAGRRDDAKIGKELAKLVGGEGCAAVMAQDTRLVN
jgi:hypothetical protein